MAGLTERELLRQLYPGWTPIARTKTGDEFIVDPQNVYSQQLIPNPAREEEWVLVGPNNARQTITVRPMQVATAPGGGEGPVETLYEVVNVPNVNPPSGSSKPDKGLTKIELEGNRWVQKVVIDDQGTWSVAVGADGKPIYVDIEKPASADSSPTTKTIGGKTYQYNPSTNEWLEARGLPPESPKPETTEPTVNTQAREIPEWNGTEWVWKKNPNFREPGADKTPEERRLTGAQATTAEAAAATAQPTAEAALRQAQANADLAALNLEDARRKSRQAPTDQQAQAAIATAQRAAELANTQLEQQIAQAGQLNPLAVQQAQVTLRRAQNAARQEQLGPDLASIRERIGEIKSLYASGEIDEQTADLMLGATYRGTTVAQGLEQIGAERTARRQQDVSSLNQRASTFGSIANQAFSTTADMNRYAQVGSSAGADALMAMMNIAQNRLKDYALPAAPETDFLGTGAGGGIRGLIGAAERQVAAPPPPAPPPGAGGGLPASATTPIIVNEQGQPTGNWLSQPWQQSQPTSAQPVNIYIGGQQPTAATPPTSPTNGLVSAAAQATPATIGDVYDAFGLTRSRSGRMGVM